MSAPEFVSCVVECGGVWFAMYACGETCGCTHKNTRSEAEAWLASWARFYDEAAEVAS